MRRKVIDLSPPHFTIHIAIGVHREINTARFIAQASQRERTESGIHRIGIGTAAELQPNAFRQQRLGPLADWNKLWSLIVSWIGIDILHERLAEPEWGRDANDVNRNLIPAANV